MNPLGNRARAAELSRLLEGGVAGPGTSTAPLVALSIRLRAVAPALDDSFAIRPEFRAALRQRVVAVATVQAASPATERAARRPRAWAAQRRFAATAGAMAAVIAFTGVAIASSRSLPGQPFYGLKRAAEGVQLSLAGSTTAKGTTHLEFAATRLREVQALAHGDSEVALGAAGTLAAGLASGTSTQQRIVETLRDFNSETTLGEGLLETAYRETGKTAPLQVLAAFTEAQKGRLTALVSELPGPSAQAAQASLDLVTAVGSTAGQLLSLGTCTTACNPSAGGPSLTVAPAPSPGAGASTEPANNGVPSCACAEPTTSPEPSPTPELTQSPSPDPRPSATPTATPRSSPTASPGPLPAPLPSVLPTSLPTILPTLLPSVLPTALPTLFR